MNKKKLQESILGLFSKEAKPLQLNIISRNLSIKSSSGEYYLLKEVLAELCEQGILEKSNKRKYSMKMPHSSDSTNAITGVLKIKNSRGTVQTNMPEMSKISIRRRHLHTALDGDIVVVKPFAMKKEKKIRGEITKILQRQERIIIGTIEYDGSFYFLMPDDEENYYIDFLIHSKKLNGAKDGDKVSAKFLHWDDPLKSPQAEVIDILGKAGNPKVEFQSVVKEFGLPAEFTQLVINEAKKFSTKIDVSKYSERLDLREKDIITIDPADAKDFDDALSLDELENGNLLLGVHIADVSHYVQKGTALDDEALKRGTSIYLVDKVIPMLPEELSNVICSLQPNRVRLSFSVLMEFTSKGRLVDYKIAETIIKSKKRFNYEEVQKILEGEKNKYSDLLIKLDTLAKTLRAKRFRSGGVDFQTLEVKFILDENQNPLEPIIRVSTDATQLVEESMLIANKTVSEHIRLISKANKMKALLPFVYRVHAEPLPEKLSSALEFIKLMGPKHNLEIKNAKDINNLLNSFDGSPKKPIVHQIMIRSMPKAEYANENIGHFGLGFKEYTHFTSPIRRYPDLVVHRLIKEYAVEIPDTKALARKFDELEEISEISTVRERIAMEAERASIKLTQTVIASKKVGEEFEGTISGVMNFGLFIMLDGLYAEGLLHIRDIFDDYYYFDEQKFRLIGRKNKRIFHFGQRIKVKIISANIEKRKIDLSLVE